MPDAPTVTLIGVPLDLGAENLGVDIGPQAFRYQKIVEKLEGVGFKLNDLGNLSVKHRKDLAVGNPHLRYLDEIVRVNEELAALTADAVRQHHIVVALGGDHSINLGVVSGASAALSGRLGLIYLDAHGDMNTEKTTLSGNIHGMHLASLLGFGTPVLRDLYKPTVKIAKNNLLHIGGSDFDQAEVELVSREKLNAFSMLDLMRRTIDSLFKMIDDLAKRVPNIWVSLDLDVIDRVYAPGAGMPNAKGLVYREVAAIAQYIGAHLGQDCKIIGVDLVEYNPLQDEDHKTADLGIELIAKLLGKDYSWYTTYMASNKIGGH